MRCSVVADQHPRWRHLGSVGRDTATRRGQRARTFEDRGLDVLMFLITLHCPHMYYCSLSIHSISLKYCAACAQSREFAMCLGGEDKLSPSLTIRYIINISTFTASTPQPLASALSAQVLSNKTPAAHMASSPRSFIRAITQSSRSHPAHAGRSSRSTLQSNILPTIHQAYESLRPSYSIAPRRNIYTPSRLYQAQPATVPRPTSAPSPATSPPSATAAKAPTPSQPGSANLRAGLSDQPKKQADESSSQIDWTTSFHGLSDAPFSKDAADVLLKPLNPGDVEIKPDGIIYLPEIKYRRILNQAFGPGGWGLAPRGESTVTAKAVTREYALLVHGR